MHLLHAFFCLATALASLHCRQVRGVVDCIPPRSVRAVRVVRRRRAPAPIVTGISFTICDFSAGPRRCLSTRPEVWEPQFARRVPSHVCPQPNHWLIPDHPTLRDRWCYWLRPRSFRLLKVFQYSTNLWQSPVRTRSHKAAHTLGFAPLARGACRARHAQSLPSHVFGHPERDATRSFFAQLSSREGID